MTRRSLLALTLLTLADVAHAGDRAAPEIGFLTGDRPAERGRQALLGHPFNPVAWSGQAYQDAWRYWHDGARQRPQPYANAFRERYGLHPAPYANGEYPMGLRAARGLFRSGITTDCLLCHGGSAAGQSYVGLGNATLDMQSLYEDMAAADGRPPSTPFVFCNVRGTNEAGAMAVYLISYRDPDLKLRSPPLKLGLRDDLCEDVPAWWLLKKKKTMYYTGSTDARSVRSNMQFMMSPLNAESTIKREEPTFRDIQAFILGLEPPAYPFGIDRGLAREGEELFIAHCARCHGTYGKEWTYPNKIVPLDVIGTDRTRYEGLSPESGQHYNRTWFAHERSGWLVDDFPATATGGYQAPPLDGVWATAPYFHNGSVPTVYEVLNTKARPAVYTRSFRTDESAYDAVKLGWKVRLLTSGADPKLSPFERRKIYDTTQRGRGNAGHTFGDDLTEPERMAVIEYLKTL
jgi:mono/diheme cytochrome c family protein